MTKRRPPTRGNHHFLKKTAKNARFNALCLAGAELRKRTQGYTHARKNARTRIPCVRLLFGYLTLSAPVSSFFISIS